CHRSPAATGALLLPVLPAARAPLLLTRAIAAARSGANGDRDRPHRKRRRLLVDDRISPGGRLCRLLVDNRAGLCGRLHPAARLGGRPGGLLVLATQLARQEKKLLAKHRHRRGARPLTSVSPCQMCL